MTPPEFALQNTTTALARIDYVSALVFGPAIGPDPTGVRGTTRHPARLGAAGGPWPAIPTRWSARIDALLLRGALSPAAHDGRRHGGPGRPRQQPTGQLAKPRSLLIATSPQYQVDALETHGPTRDFLDRGARAWGCGTSLRPISGPCCALSAHTAQARPEHKALVCVFLFGGVDGNDVLVPVEQPATRNTARA